MPLLSIDVILASEFMEHGLDQDKTSDNFFHNRAIRVGRLIRETHKGALWPQSHLLDFHVGDIGTTLT